MKKILISLMGTVFFAAPAFSETAQQSPLQPVAPIVIGSGVVTGLYYPAAGMIQRLANDQAESAGVSRRFAVESTGGTADNLKALQEGALGVAIAQSDKVAEAAKTMPALRGLLALHPESLALIVKNDSPLKTFSDLKGHALNLGPEGSSPRILVSALAAAQGWGAADLAKVSDLALGDQATALCLGTVEVISYVVPHPNAAVAQALAQCPTRLIPLSAAEVSALTQKSPAYTASVIHSGDYAGVDQDFSSVGVRAVLVSTDKLPADAAQALVSAALSNPLAMGLVHTSLGALGEADIKAVEAFMPLHEGAKAALAEIQAKKAAPAVVSAPAAPAVTSAPASPEPAPKVDEPAPPAP